MHFISIYTITSNEYFLANTKIIHPLKKNTNFLHTREFQELNEKSPRSKNF